MVGKKILIVDDEDDIREVAKASLELVGGLEVTTASSGCQGIEMAKTVQPDAILLDVMMPDMDGPTTFQNIRSGSRTRNIPVILLTAKTRNEDLQQLEALGVTGILEKPFNPMTISQDLINILGWDTP